MGFEKFDKHAGGDYWERYFTENKDVINVTKEHISSFISKEKPTFGLDIGAGPGIGAFLLSSLGLTTTLTGFEPSKTIQDSIKLAQELRKKSSPTTYLPKQGGIQDIQRYEKELFDYILILRASHEIAESLGSKKRFFEEISRLLPTLKKDGVIIISEPQYTRKENSIEIIKEVQEYQKIRIGHFHIPSDYIMSTEMKKEMKQKSLSLLKEDILPNNRLLTYLNDKDLNLKSSPCSFYVQTYHK